MSLTDGQPRRRFLKQAALGVAVLGGGLARATAQDETPPVAKPLSFGLVTDVHNADMPTAGNRHYRDAPAKLKLAIDVFQKEKVAFVAELGDLINAGPSKEVEKEYLRAIGKELERFDGDIHYVLGNHCVDTLTKEEFLTTCGRDPKRTYYSFDVSGYHLVVLDADFLEDGTPSPPGNFTWTGTWTPKAEMDWLAADLQQAQGRPAVVFIHQNLNDETDAHGVKNAPAVRKILEEAGNVAVVFQGHMHTGGLTRIGGIPYCTLRAMVEGAGVENRAFAIVTLRGRKVEVDGFGKQRDYLL